MRDHWRVVGGEVRMNLEEAEWWGASLAALVAAIHHPGMLAQRQPGTEAAQVAEEVLAQVAELYRVAAGADEQAHRAKGGRGSAPVRREADEVVFSPGGEVANLALCLEIFASAVLDASCPEAAVARGATAHGAAAWSAEIGKAAGTVPPQPRRPVGGEGEAVQRGWADARRGGIHRKAEG